MPLTSRNPVVRSAGLAALFCFGVLICLYFGRFGFNPLDQSVVFDGGWRILSGQLPFRDFTALTGSTPSLIQAAFFGIIGVNYFAYCLHAAIFNGIFCLLVFQFLRIFRLPPGVTFLYAALSGIGFYPLMGTPYMEQHGFFFLLTAMLLLHACVRERRGWARLGWSALASISFLACFLSKQNTALFGLLPLSVFLLFLLRGRNARRCWGTIAAGAILASLSAAAVAMLLRVSPRSLFDELFVVPLIVSGGRGSPLKWVLFGPFIQGLNLITVGLSSIAFAAGLATYWRGVPGRPQRVHRTVWLAAMAASFEIACMVFARSTDNQKENCFPFVFLSLGLLHAAARSAPGLRFHAAPLTAALVILSLRDATQFVNYVKSRSVQDIDFQRERVIPFQTPALRFLHYQTWWIYRAVTPPALDKLIALLRESPDNFLLIGDFAILYGLTGKPSPLPSLWFHQALGLPAFRGTLLTAYERQLLSRLHTHSVKTIVLERDATWAGVSLATFPALGELVRKRTRSTQSIGPFTILHLSEPF